MRNLILLLLLASPALASAETVRISRYLLVESCTKGEACVGPAAKDLENANVEIALKPFRSGEAAGLLGESPFKFKDSGRSFTGSIRVVKHESPAALKGKYTLAAMLDGQKGRSKTVRVRLGKFEDLDEVTLVGERVSARGGSLFPELVVGPAPPITR